MGDLSYIRYSLIAELLWDHWLGGNNAAGLWMVLGVAMIFIKNNKSSRFIHSNKNVFVSFTDQLNVIVWFTNNCPCGMTSSARVGRVFFDWDPILVFFRSP